VLNGALLVVLWLLTGALLAPTVVFCLQCLASLLPGRGRDARAAVTDDPNQSRPRVAVLVPAHNEQETLGSTLGALRPQLRDGDVLMAANPAPIT